MRADGLSGDPPFGFRKEKIMFWRRRCTKKILIVLPDDDVGKHRYKYAIYKYLEEFHKDDIRKGRIMYGILYSHPMVTEEIQLYGNCDIDIYELHHYISEYAKSTDPIMKGE